MLPKIDDRWLWLGLGACLFGAFKGISCLLSEVEQLNEVQERPTKTLCPVSQQTEKAIKLQSLRTLALSPNIEMRNAAIKILCNRLNDNSRAKEIICQDLRSDDPELRDKAMKALHLIKKHSSSILGEFDFDGQGLESSANLQSQMRPRRHEESPEEQEIRRRRRQAIVLNEGNRPISQDDIIQQGERPRDDETRRTERALASLSNGAGQEGETQQDG